MKPEPGGSKRNRILLIYILGVVIPGMVLGFMAFRGIRGNDALREKELRQELNLVAQDFFQILNRHFSDTLILKEHADLILEKSDHLQLLSSHMLFLPDDFLPAPDLRFLLQNHDRGWELEFMDNNLPGAESFYSNRISGATPSGALPETWLSLARVQRKLHKTQAALDTYAGIEMQFQGETVGFWPVELTVFQQRTEIYLQENDTVAATGELRAMATYLRHPKTQYNEQVFQLFQDMLTQHPDLLPTSDSILSDLDRELERTSYLTKFLSRADDYLASPVDQMIYLAHPGYHDLLVSRVIDSSLTRAFVINLDRLISRHANDYMTTADPSAGLFWRILDEGDREVMSNIQMGSENLVGIAFPAPLSGWILELNLLPHRSLTEWMRSGQGFLGVMFVLMVLWILIGFFFTIYLIQQEIRLSRMKTRFISNVSHEFKSPVTSIRHMAELLKMRRVRTEEKKDDFYDMMMEQCDHLSHLVDNILDFSKIEDEIKSYRFEEVDVVNLVKSIVDQFRGRVEEGGGELQCICEEGIPVIRADADALRQVVYNLLDNAVKYGGGRMEMGLKGLGAKGLGVEIWVRDWGDGMGEEELPFIFDRFYRGEHEGVKGSGIGLTIVKKIVEAHGGRIMVESARGKGSVFSIIIPFKA